MAAALRARGTVSPGLAGFGRVFPDSIGVILGMNSSDNSDVSDKPEQSDGMLPPHGGYSKLRSFQTSELVYDGTVIFCERFI